MGQKKITQPLEPKKKSPNISGQKNHITSRDLKHQPTSQKKKSPNLFGQRNLPNLLGQPLRTKKPFRTSQDLSGLKTSQDLPGLKNQPTSWDKKNHQTFWGKKLPNHWGQKKSSNLSGQKKIIKPLETKKNYLTSCDKIITNPSGQI